jgi:hypothetical protein
VTGDPQIANARIAQPSAKRCMTIPSTSADQAVPGWRIDAAARAGTSTPASFNVAVARTGANETGQGQNRRYL